MRTDLDYSVKNLTKIENKETIFIEEFMKFKMEQKLV